ncbi:alpha/beta hydrolase [Terrilactibacillus sp. S3-3]|nr:alpha/beta hydrolase [Terrilactibacillus sp. S3-3]
MPTFETSAGIQIYYETYGNGQPLIFIHPPLMGHVVFRYQRELAAKYQVVLYDLRGNGRSGYCSPYPGVSETEAHIDDLNELSARLQLNHPVIVGYSNGGLLALEYALKFKKEIGALILSGGYPKVASLALAREYFLGIILMLLDQRDILSRKVSKNHKVTDQDLAILFRYGLKADAHAVMKLYWEGLRYDAANQLEKLADLPMLLLYGSDDKNVKKHKKYFETLPKAQIAFIDGALHQLPTRWHRPFNAAIDQFLADLSID